MPTLDNLFTIESTALPTSARVLAWTGTEAISHTYLFEIYVLIAAHDGDGFDPVASVTQRATLRALREDGTARMSFHGVMASVQLVHQLPGDHLLRLVLVPALWNAGLSQHSRVFVNKSLPDILEATFKNGGLAGDDYELRLQGSYRPVEHVTQYRESDLDFAQRLMEHAGIYYFFEHGDEKEKLIVTDNKSFHERFSPDPLHYFAGSNTDGAPDALRSFSLRAAYLPSKVKLKDYDPTHPLMDVSGEAEAVHAGGGQVVRHGMDYFLTPGDGRKLAAARAQYFQSGHKVFVGSGRAFDLRSGYTFELSDHPRENFNGEYLATQVDHHGNMASAAPEAAALLGIYDDGEPYQVDVTAIAGDVQYRPAQATPRPRVWGFESAIVCGEQDHDYAQLDEHGRYLLRFRFDENDPPGGKGSTRVRMAQPHAGSPEGWHAPLRKGTEVLVAFVSGDPDRPVIVGTVHDSEKPASVTDTNGTRNMFRTGAENRLEIEDTDGTQHLVVFSPDNQSFFHLGATHDEISHNYAASTDGNALIHTGDDFNVRVGGNKTEKVKNAVKETYKDTQSTKVTSDVLEEYSLTQSTTVDGHVEEKYDTHTTKVKALKTENTQTQKVTVENALNEKVGLQITSVSGSFEEKCAEQEVQVSALSIENYATLTFQCSGDLEIQAGGLILVSAPSATWTCGSMAITASVYMEIAGPKIGQVGPDAEKKGVSIGVASKGLTAIGVKTETATVGFAGIGVKYDQVSASLEMLMVKIELAGAEEESGTFHGVSKTLELIV